jgi:serralysin
MPNGKGITYRSGPRFGDSTGESLTLEGANSSERQMLNDVTNELQDYTGEGRGNAQNGSVEIDNGVQKYRVETTLGTATNDTITGHGMLVGGKGSDRLTGRERSDILLGGDNGDNLIGGAGADHLDGGNGFDYAEYHTATAGVVADLSNAGRNTGDAKGDSYVSIEGLGGSQFNDELVGNHLGNEIYGLSGNDALEGRGGADWLYGGAGFDYAQYSAAASGVVADLLNAWRNTGEAAGDSYVSIEGLSGSAYNDELVGNHAGNELYGNGGDDMLEGRGGGDWMYGGAGTDFASYLTATSGVRASLANSGINTGEAAGDMYFSVEALNGSQFGDVLVGDGGNNSIYGQNGNDELAGGAGADFLSGGQHHDTLSGGAGADLLNGGSGADVFQFDGLLGSGNVDTIVDFSAAEGDKLALETHVFRAFPDVAFVETAYGSSYVNNVMKASAFGLGAAATTAAQRIVYNQATGGLFYDADGTGAAAQVQFAQLKAGLALTAANFSLYTL